jgi:hypothetical protein
MHRSRRNASPSRVDGSAGPKVVGAVVTGLQTDDNHVNLSARTERAPRGPALGYAATTSRYYRGITSATPIPLGTSLGSLRGDRTNHNGEEDPDETEHEHPDV